MILREFQGTASDGKDCHAIGEMPRALVLLCAVLGTLNDSTDLTVKEFSNVANGRHEVAADIYDDKSLFGQIVTLEGIYNAFCVTRPVATQLVCSKAMLDFFKDLWVFRIGFRKHKPNGRHRVDGRDSL